MSFVKEIPVFDVTYEKLVDTYVTLLSFVFDLKVQGLDTGKFKAWTQNPKFVVEEFLYMSLYGYTKSRDKLNVKAYTRGRMLQKSFDGRMKHFLGEKMYLLYMEYRKSLEKMSEITQKQPEFFGFRGELLRELPVESKGKDVDEIEIAEIEERMRIYIQDFDLHSSVDKDILKNYVLTQFLIEKRHKKMLKGSPASSDLKELSDQLRNYINILGLSKKDRIDLGSERKRGSIAELSLIYEETLSDYENVEEQFLAEELEMLLRKYERRNLDGDREITEKTFRVVSGGFTIEESKQFVRDWRNKEKRRQNNTPY